LDHKELHTKTMALFVIKQRLRQSYENIFAGPFTEVAKGHDLDLLAAMLGIFRKPFETDRALRARCKAECAASGGKADG